MHTEQKQVVLGTVSVRTPLLKAHSVLNVQLCHNWAFRFLPTTKVLYVYESQGRRFYFVPMTSAGNSYRHDSPNHKCTIFSPHKTTFAQQTWIEMWWLCLMHNKSWFEVYLYKRSHVRLLHGLYGRLHQFDCSLQLITVLTNQWAHIFELLVLSFGDQAHQLLLTLVQDGHQAVKMVGQLLPLSLTILLRDVRQILRGEAKKRSRGSFPCAQ